ncbi:MAG TPA: LamG-like jellyroll fold domain-containing protein, partial [Rhizobacter sp.]
MGIPSLGGAQAAPIAQPPLRAMYGAVVPTIPNWTPPGDSGQPSAEELNKLTAPRIMIPAANTAIPIVYGRDRLFGRPFFVSVDEAGGFLYLGLMFCEGTITSFDAIYMDGVDITAPKGLLSVAGAAVNQHLGIVGDVVDPILQAGAAFVGVGGGSPPAFTDTMPGTAYLALKIPKKASKGFPRIEAIIRGRKVYDPRKDSTNGGSGAHRFDNPSTWEFSTNPTLCFADFAAVRIGWGLHWPGVIDNANANDELLSNGRKRREIGLTLANPSTAQQWVQGFRVYMGAFVSWEEGALRVIPERADVEAPYGLWLNRDKSAAPYDWVSMPVSAGQNVGSGNFTISAQIQPDKLNVLQALVANTAGSGSVPGWVFRLTAAGRLELWMCNGTTTATVTSDALDLSITEFQHVAVLVDRAAGEVAFTLNGEQVGAIKTFTLTGALSDGTSALRLGGLSNNAQNYFGKLDEVRVWNAIKTSADYAQWIGREVSPVPADLIGYYKLNSLNGNTARDDSANAAHGAVNGTPTWTLGNPQVIPAGVAFHFDGDYIQEDGLRLRHRSSRTYPNSIMIEYVDDSYNVGWRTARVQVDAPKVTAGMQGRRVSQIELPGIHNAAQAYREAVERLNWFLSDLEGTLEVFDEGLKIQNGSVIALTHPMGLNAKLFRVRRVQGDGGRWMLDISEYDPAGYSDAVITTPTIPDTNLGNPLTPPAVTGLSCVEELFSYKNGITGSRVRAVWAASSYAFISGYIVEGYVNGTRVFQSVSLLNEAVTPPVEELVGDAPVTYEVRVAVQTPYAVGAFTTVQTTVLGKLAPPSNVPSLTLQQLKSDQVKLTWAPATDIDIWRYEVRRAPFGGTWASATPLDLVDGLSYVATGLGLGTWVFFVKARDTVRNESPVATAQTITLTAPPPVTTLTGFEVGGTLRLSWTPPAGAAYIARYRVAYSDVPQTFERTLDVVDTLTFSTNEVAEGTYDFKVYSVDDAGREAATAPTRRISVTSDQEAFLADVYDFVSPTVTNMISWTLRTDPAVYWVTNMGGVFLSNPSTFLTFQNSELANYHAAGASQWLSETHDFETLLTGNWLLESDLAVLEGTATVALELSRDNSVWESFPSSPPVSAKG